MDDLSRFCCRACKYRFSERKGTPLFDSRLVLEVVVGKRLDTAAEMLMEGLKGRPAGPRRAPPAGTCYGRVIKHKKKGRLERVEPAVVFGELAEGQAISTSYLERQNATNRHRNGRKGRKTYRFSKGWETHEAMTAFTMYSYNFC